jgi:hypothetical protein
VTYRHGAPQPVDILDRKSEDLALAKTKAGRGGRCDAIPPGQGFPDCCDRSTVKGTTLRSGFTGRRTDPAEHGFFLIRSSSTAALKMVDTLVKIVRAYAGAIVKPRIHACTVDGWIFRNCLSPSTG